jgi:hypothetical protein
MLDRLLCPWCGFTIWRADPLAGGILGDADVEFSRRANHVRATAIRPDGGKLTEIAHLCDRKDD